MAKPVKWHLSTCSLLLLLEDSFVETRGLNTKSMQYKSYEKTPTHYVKNVRFKIRHELY